MPIVNYPFIDINGDGSPKPALLVNLINPANGLDFTTWALIDTGADTTVIPGFIARKLYHDIKHKDVKTDYYSGIGGGATTYFHTFRLQFLESDRRGHISGKIAIRINKKLFAVVENLHTMILGEKDFLRKYVLTIDYSKRVFSIRRP